MQKDAECSDTKTTKTKDVRIDKVRFQKIGGAVVCPQCHMYLGQPPYLNGVVNEGRIRVTCPECIRETRDGFLVSVVGKLRDFKYVGRTKVTLVNRNGREFSANATCQHPDKFSKKLGFEVAYGRALKKLRNIIMYNMHNISKE